MTALGAAAASLALTVIGARFSDTRTVLIGTAFAVMAALLALARDLDTRASSSRSTSTAR